MTNSHIPQEWINYIKYKWEFLIRNQKYIEEWERMKKSCLEKDENWDPWKVTQTDEELNFCKKWNIRYPVSPTLNYKECIQKAEEDWERTQKYLKYREEWERLKKSCLEKDENWDPMKVPQTDEELNFCKKWNIRNPVDPILIYKGSIQVRKLEAADSDSPSYYPVHGRFGTHHLLSKIFLPSQFSQMPLTPIDTYTYEIEGGTDIDLSDKILRDGLLKIQANLNYSKNRLLKEFKSLISKWKQIYEDAYRNNLYSDMQDENLNETSKIADKEERARQDVIFDKKFEKVYRQKLNSRKKMYEPKYHFDNFDIYLQVYDLRQKGKSWQEITSSLNLNSIQTARNHCNAARKIIKEGIDLYVK